jgi:hypothetical protein
MPILSSALVHLNDTEIRPRRIPMQSQYCALLSMVFMMIFVALFDGTRQRRRDNRQSWVLNLLSQQDLDQLMMIMPACQDE